MKTLYTHQTRFLTKNPNRALLVWETGTGKSLAACEWLKKRLWCTQLVICPKAIVGKWERDIADSGLKARVITSDGIKTTDLTPYDAIVVDEAQNFASPLFDKSRSARATRLYNHKKDHSNAHVLLLTATPVRSTPWNIHTLACYMGIFWPVQAFRNKFYYLTDIYGRMHYELKDGWQKAIRPYVEEIADIVLMKDCVDVPKQEDVVMRLKAPKLPQDDIYREPSAQWYFEHRNEQVSKLVTLRELLDGYRKAIVVCFYTEQIEQYARELGKDRQVFVLSGSTKNADEVIADAQNAVDGVFIIQASMGAGFDADQFSVVIFASLSFRYVDYVQMRGRVKRIHNLHENLFIHLLAGKCDEAVYNTIMAGKDFDVHHQ